MVTTNGVNVFPRPAELADAGGGDDAVRLVEHAVRCVREAAESLTIAARLLAGADTAAAPSATEPAGHDRPDRPSAGEERTRPAGQERPSLTEQDRPSSDGQERAGSAGQDRPPPAGQDRSWSAGQDRPPAAGQDHPWQDGQERSWTAGQERPWLTGQERRVLTRLAAGLSNRQIAQSLGISDKTAKNYVHAVLGKLNAGSRTEAAFTALCERLVDPEECRRLRRRSGAGGGQASVVPDRAAPRSRP